MRIGLTKRQRFDREAEDVAGLRRSWATRTRRPQATTMAYHPLFRDVEMPSAQQDRRAHEAFLLDTHLERRAQPRPRLVDRLRALLRGDLR